MTDVAKMVAPLLAEIGFKKRAGGIFTIDLGDDVIGWVGLNQATKHRPAGEVEVYPQVGVRHQGVERIIAACRAEKFHPYIPPTVVSPLGYVFPDPGYRAWVFGGAFPADVVGPDMAGAIEKHGLRFMRSTTGLPEICRAIENRMGYDHLLRERLPVALLLDGHPKRAREVLDEALEGLGDRTDVAAEEFRRFAKVFRERIDSRSS